MPGTKVWRCGRGAKILNWAADLQKKNSVCVSPVLPLHVLLAGKLQGSQIVSHIHLVKRLRADHGPEVRLKPSWPKVH